MAKRTKRKAKETKEEIILKAALLLILFVVISLQLLYIYVQNSFTEVTPQYVAIEDQIESLKKEHALLYEEDLRERSLVVVSEKAREMGFIQAKYYLLK